MFNHDPEELLARFKAGDKAAFEEVFRAYFKPLRLNAFLILRNEQEAEDLVQQLFLDIWNQQLYGNIQKSLKAYLHTSIKHRCLNFLKRANRQTRSLHEYAGQLEKDTVDSEEQPSPKLLTALDGLPAQQLKAFHLVHMENKRYQEAALEMGISINSLKSHLKLAVKFVRIKLKTSLIHPYSK